MEALARPDGETLVAMDFETANARPTSACALGLAFSDGSRSRKLLLRPVPFEFDPWSVAVHGITAEQVADAPTFADAYPEIRRELDGRTVVAHNARFDAKVLAASISAAGLEPVRFRCLCSMLLARRVWPGLVSYSLPALCADFGIHLRHHDPESDAEAALAIVTRAERDMGAAKFEELLADLRHQAAAPALDPGAVSVVSFTGRRIAFTGTLLTMTRAEAKERVVAAGATATEQINARLNFLVLGMEAFADFYGGAPSRKAREAKDLVAAGAPLELLSESDFLRML